MIKRIVSALRATAQTGDTLIEVSIAIAILGLVLTSSFNIANLSYSLGSQARERTIAVGLAQAQGEQLRIRRDDLMKAHKADLPGPIINNSSVPGSFGNCNPACYLSPDVTATPTSQTSIKLTTCSVSTNCLKPTGTFYNVAVIPANTNTDRYFNATIRVTWTSAIGSTQNTSDLPITLVDNRIPADSLIDCTAGDASCSR